VTKILDPNVTQVKDILLQKGSLSKLVKLWRNLQGRGSKQEAKKFGKDQGQK
jgi:hypothetical protein